MPVQAQFPSNCDYCSEEIEEGDEIEMDDEYGWVHDDCASAIAEEQNGSL